MSHAYEIDNRPFVRTTFAVLLTLAMWLALVPRHVVAQNNEVIYTPSIEAKTFLDEAISFSTDCTGRFAAWTWGDFWEVWYLGNPEDQNCQFDVPERAVEFQVVGFEAMGTTYDHGDFRVTPDWIGFDGEDHNLKNEERNVTNPAWMTLFFSPRYLEPAN